MTGTILNCAGILIGAILGRTLRKAPQRSTEAYVRIVLAAFIVFYGLRMTWKSMNGTFTGVLLQLLVTVLSLSIGKLLGQLIGLQRLSNRIGRFARDRIAAVETATKAGTRTSADSWESFNDGFLVCTALFCAAPLAIVGAVQDGFSSYFHPLAAKGVIEGFAAMGFARMFGWGAGLSVLPVLAFQGTITLLVNAAQPWMNAHDLIDPVNAVGGFLVFSVSLVILDIKKLHLADYLPSLLVAPSLTWLIRHL